MLVVDDSGITQQEEYDSGDDLMAISAQAVGGTSEGKTLKLNCHISKIPAIVLVDLGSSHSFISEQFATQLSNWKRLEKPIQVKVADVGVLLCTHEVPGCDWLVQGVQFQSAFKILPLKCYDAILGMDWLEKFSPMEVQWAEKWISFWYKKQKVKLQGLKASVNQCLPLSGDQYFALQKEDGIWCAVQVNLVEQEKSATDSTILPQEIQALVHNYRDLFADPKGLPPSRVIDHTIPLLNGSQPFKLRPYRYTSAQKTEFEERVRQLLRNGMIQASLSPFASPVC